ncbi:MAG: hypothetical protein KBD83_04500 [Gammaproteobacteria bacterium]|nr:hypothetical protein [Gammaproteobacteria bacterium]
MPFLEEYLNAFFEKKFTKNEKKEYRLDKKQKKYGFLGYSPIDEKSNRKVLLSASEKIKKIEPYMNIDDDVKQLLTWVDDNFVYPDFIRLIPNPDRQDFTPDDALSALNCLVKNLNEESVYEDPDLYGEGITINLKSNYKEIERKNTCRSRFKDELASNKELSTRLAQLAVRIPVGTLDQDPGCKSVKLFLLDAKRSRGIEKREKSTVPVIGFLIDLWNGGTKKSRVFSDALVAAKIEAKTSNTEKTLADLTIEAHRGGKWYIPGMFKPKTRTQKKLEKTICQGQLA